MALEDDPRAIKRMPACSHRREKDDTYHDQFAERIIKACKRETAP